MFLQQLIFESCKYYGAIITLLPHWNAKKPQNMIINEGNKINTNNKGKKKKNLNLEKFDNVIGT